MIIFIFLALVLFLIVFVNVKRKSLKLANLSLFTGGVKTGKTTLSVWIAYCRYRFIHLKWRLTKWKTHAEEPLLYSNIPLFCDYVPLTLDIIERRERPRYKSVIYVDEASLLADSLLGTKLKDETLQERLNLFNKLIAHETHGGYLFYDTQSVQDVHNSIKRSLGSYIYIHHLVRWIPFVLVFFVREMTYVDGVSSVDVADTEESLKWCIVPKKAWKLFDCYAFSSFTDSLPCKPKVVHGKKLRKLKAKDIVSFRTFNTLKEGVYNAPPKN